MLVLPQAHVQWCVVLSHHTDPARLAQEMGDGDLLRSQRPVGGERAVAIRMAPGQYAATIPNA